MISALLSIAVLIVLGVLAALAMLRHPPLDLLFGVGVLLGAGIGYALLFLLSITGAVWSPLTLGGAAVAAFLLLLAFTLKKQPRVTPVPWSVVDLATAGAVVIHTLYACDARLWSWDQSVPLWRRDFWSIWGLKAQLFLAAGGLDWNALAQLDQRLSHPDYPLMVPLLLDWVAVLGGSDIASPWSGLLFSSLGAALLLIIRDFFREELPSVSWAATATFACVPVALTAYIGLADGPLIAFTAAGLLFLRRWMERDDPLAATLGWLFLGLGTLIKNEGMALLVSAALALLVVSGRRPWWRLWPALAIALSWVATRWALGLHTDLFTGPVLLRAAQRLRDPAELKQLWVVSSMPAAGFWIMLIIGLIVLVRQVANRERFFLLITGFQLSFYVLAYLISPYEMGWHVISSWGRLSWHLAAPLAFALLLQAGSSNQRQLAVGSYS